MSESTTVLELPVVEATKEVSDNSTAKLLSDLNYFSRAGDQITAHDKILKHLQSDQNEMHVTLRNMQDNMVTLLERVQKLPQQPPVAQVAPEQPQAALHKEPEKKPEEKPHEEEVIFGVFDEESIAHDELLEEIRLNLAAGDALQATYKRTYGFSWSEILYSLPVTPGWSLIGILGLFFGFATLVGSHGNMTAAIMAVIISVFLIYYFRPSLTAPRKPRCGPRKAAPNKRAA